MDSNLRVKVGDIDFYKSKTMDHGSQWYGITVIQSHILRWIQDNHIDFNLIKSTKFKSLLLNKITYFSATKLQKINNNFVIPRGWFKYGPCYEQGRRGEDSFTLEFFPNVKPCENEAIPEIADVCKEEIPLFLESITKEPDFPHEYLRHVYSEKASDYELGQKFYVSKNELGDCVHQIFKDAYSGLNVDDLLSKLDKLSIQFDKVITSSYIDEIGINESEKETFLDYSMLLNHQTNELVENINNLKTQLPYQVLKNFDNTFLMLFAYKNYKQTFISPSWKYSRDVKKSCDKNYEQYLNKTKTLLNQFYTSLT